MGAVPATIDIFAAAGLRPDPDQSPGIGPGPIEPGTYSTLIDRFQAWRAGASAHTIRAVAGDLRRYSLWCRQEGRAAVPAGAGDVAAYIDHLMAADKARATISRAVATVALVHKLAGVGDPTKDQRVVWALRGMRKRLARPQRQAAPLRCQDAPIVLSDLLGLPVQRLADRRDQALISLAYDTGLRRSELVAVDCRDLVSNGTAWSLTVPRTKTSTEADVVFLSEETIRLVALWRDEAGLVSAADAKTPCPLFRAIDRFGRVGSQALQPRAVNRIIKDLVCRAAVGKGLPPDMVQTLVAAFSGHSARVGSTQDLTVHGVDILPICHARGWKTTDMPLRYIRSLAVHQSPAGVTLQKLRRAHQQPE